MLKPQTFPDLLPNVVGHEEFVISGVAHELKLETVFIFIVFIDTHFWQVKHVFVLEWINDVKEFLHRGIIEVHCEVHFPIGL